MFFNYFKSKPIKKSFKNSKILIFSTKVTHKNILGYTEDFRFTVLESLNPLPISDPAGFKKSERSLNTSEGETIGLGPGNCLKSTQSSNQRSP